MRPSLSLLVRSVLLRESSDEISSDAASRPPDPAEGDEPEIDPDRTDVFHSVYEKDKADLDDHFNEALGAIAKSEHDQVLRDRREVGAGWIDRYMDRLASRPLTARESEVLFRRGSGASWTLKDIYNRSVSWCLISEEFVDLISSSLERVGARRVVEVAAGRGVLARIMRKRGVSWQAYDATSVSSPGVKRMSAQRVLQGLRPGECDAIFVSWAHFEDDWDLSLLDASERLRIPLFTIAVTPDIKGGTTINSAGGAPSYTHSPGFWDRVQREFAVSLIKSDTAREDDLMVLTPRALGIHQIPETGYHTSEAYELMIELDREISKNVGDEDLPYAVEWKLGGVQGTDYEDKTVKTAENLVEFARSLVIVQNQEARAEGRSILPSPEKWLPDLVMKYQSVRNPNRTEIVLLPAPKSGSWFEMKSY
jgi:hypothetical protein